MKPIAPLLISLLLTTSSLPAQPPSEPAYSLERTIAHSGFDGETCWVHARAGAIPAGLSDEDSDTPTVIMTMQKLLLSGSDVFYALHQSETHNLGKSWSEPQAIDSFQRQRVTDASAEPEQLPTGASIAPQLLQTGDETTVCDFTPQWHASSERLLGIGQTVWYRDNHVMHRRPRGIAYAAYDPQAASWSDWNTVQLPRVEKFRNAGSGSVQRVDLPGGDILLPIYFKEPDAKQYSVTVCHCRFDGRQLSYVEHGDELTIPVKRGLYEPSLTQFAGRYYLTIRNDDHGYVSVSDDGLHFDTPRRWTFDDGSELGNYNTQQHWVTHSDNLYLAYTRRDANNDHVFRHRAPLFIARVDADALQVIRQTEQVLVPEHGARLGNFGVVDVSPQETWVTVTEWMQPEGVEQYGSDNRVHVAKLKWNRPNQQLVEATERSAAAPAPAPWETIKWYFSPAKRWQDDRGEYRSPLRFADGSKAATAEDWRRRRDEIRSEWTALLGEWPPLITDPQVEILSTEPHEGYTQHRIRFRWTPNEVTTGYLLIPDGPGPHPGIVTVYYEPETAIGEGKPNRDYALQLARRGFAALSIGTSESTAAGTYALYYPSIEKAEVEPLSMLGYAAANAYYVLASRPDVDAERIGIVGHSFGGKWAMFASCLFDKFGCAAWSDPGIVFDESRPSVNYWEPWYLGYHPQPWRKRGVITEANPARGLYPKLTAAGHDLHELHALMAPRPFLVSGGAEDRPKRWQALQHSIAVNRLLGQENRVAMTNRPDHGPNAASNEVIYAFFEHFLQPGSESEREP